MIAAMSFFAAIDARLVGPLEHARHDQRGEDAEDHDHHHDLDQREAARGGARRGASGRAAVHRPIIIRAGCRRVRDGRAHRRRRRRAS